MLQGWAGSKIVVTEDLQLWWPVISSGGGNQITRGKPLPDLKSLATFSHAMARIRNWAVVRDK